MYRIALCFTLALGACSSPAADLAGPRTCTIDTDCLNGTLCGPDRVCVPDPNYMAPFSVKVTTLGLTDTEADIFIEFVGAPASYDFALIQVGSTDGSGDFFSNPKADPKTHSFVVPEHNLKPATQYWAQVYAVSAAGVHADGHLAFTTAPSTRCHAVVDERGSNRYSPYGRIITRYKRSGCTMEGLVVEVAYPVLLTQNGTPFVPEFTFRFNDGLAFPFQIVDPYPVVNGWTKVASTPFFRHSFSFG